MYENRTEETSSSTGTGDFTLAGAATGKYTFSSSFAIGAFFPYVITNGAENEVGIGHLSASTTLVRDRVLRSSNANALVSFSAGTKQVFNDAEADSLLAATNAASAFGNLTLS